MERVSWDLARALSSSGDLVVLTTPVPGMPSSFVAEGVRVETVAGTRPGKYSPRWWFSTARFSAAKTFDVVLSVSAAATAMIHLQRGPWYIFQAHGTAMRELQGNLRVRSRLWFLKVLRYAYWVVLDSATYRRADVVVAASEQVAGSLRGWPYAGAWKNTELQVIPNATDTGHFVFSDESRVAERSRHGISETDTVVLTVSRLDRQKGADRVIDAVALASSSVKYAIGGVGPAEPELRELAGSKDVLERVIFLGELDREAVLAALCAADVFVLPVRNFEREALPLSVLEALSVGIRVIVPAESKWPEDIMPLLEFVDVADPEALSLAIAAHGATATPKGNRLSAGYSLEAWAKGYLPSSD